MREGVLRVEQVELMAYLIKHLSNLLAIYKIASIALRSPPPLVLVIVLPSPPCSATATQVHGEWLWGELDEVGLLLVGSKLPEDLAFGQTPSTQEEGLCEFVVFVIGLLDISRFLPSVINFGLVVVKVRVGRRSQERLERRGRGSFPVI
jgi:hypothetical protein